MYTSLGLVIRPENPQATATARGLVEQGREAGLSVVVTSRDGIPQGFDHADYVPLNELAKHCDLVYVFLDPHGGATQMRTMNVLKRLKKLEKSGHDTFTVKTFLTKIDQAKTLL